MGLIRSLRRLLADVFFLASQLMLLLSALCDDDRAIDWSTKFIDDHFKDLYAPTEYRKSITSWDNWRNNNR